METRQWKCGGNHECQWELLSRGENVVAVKVSVKEIFMVACREIIVEMMKLVVGKTAVSLCWEARGKRGGLDSRRMDYPFVIYRNNRRNVKTENGDLKLTPTLMETEFGQDFVRVGNLTLERCTEPYQSQSCQKSATGAYILPPIMSGALDTKSSFAFLYGKVEIRAKLPRGDWIYPVLTLEPIERMTNLGSWTTYPSMRVASSSGNPVLSAPGGRDLSGRVLCSGPVEVRTGVISTASLPRRYSDNLWSDDYHIYELEWRRDRILSRVDGLEYGTTNTQTPFDRPFYLNLAVAVGGQTEFPDLSISNGYTKPWRNVAPKSTFDFFNATNQWASTWNDQAVSLKIDYIRVWAL